MVAKNLQGSLMSFGEFSRPELINYRCLKFGARHATEGEWRDGKSTEKQLEPRDIMKGIIFLVCLLT